MLYDFFWVIPWYLNSEGGELPGRKHATFRTRRKFEIKKDDASSHIIVVYIYIYIYIYILYRLQYENLHKTYVKHLNCKLYYQQLHLKYLCNFARYWLQAPWGWHDSVRTCTSVIICEIIVHLLVIVQNIKKTVQYFIVFINNLHTWPRAVGDPRFRRLEGSQSQSEYLGWRQHALSHTDNRTPNLRPFP
jgi:hypothetical protein